LNLRANKSRKDGHDHEELSADVQDILSSGEFSAQKLGDIYENRLSESHRNQEGIYYTPRHIVEDLLQPDDSRDFSAMTFCDPCCGSGNFIMRALELGFLPENVFGFDTDANAVAITRRRILEKTGFHSNNIRPADFLRISSGMDRQLFDFIYTNPPWGKKLPKPIRESYAQMFGAGRSIDTSALFFFACLNSLKRDGRLGLLLPEAFFNISTFSSARAKALSLRVERLIDYGKPFKGLLTQAQAIVLTNAPSGAEPCQISCTHEGRTFVRTSDSFTDNPKLILNIACDVESAEVINHMYALPHITLKGNAKWGLGIVTGNNSRFCKKHPMNGYLPVLKGSDITKLGLKKPSVFIPNDLSQYQQVAPLELYEADEKLIYKFISSSLCFFYDTEQRFVLNSANMLIPSKQFPVKAKQLCDLLNSTFMDWVFRTVFGTHKVLRGDLECLPVHVGYFEKYPEFDEATYLDYLNIEQTADGTYRVKG